MTCISISIKTPFGEINVSGDTTEEVLDSLSKLNQDFIMEVNNRISEILVTQAKDDLKGIIDVRLDGPIIVTKAKLSHYASIGLILYALQEHQSSSREITKRLAASGKQVTVPARLHEMGNRGPIFKPVDRAPYYKLSTEGVTWIEEKVLPPLKKK